MTGQAPHPAFIPSRHGADIATGKRIARKLGWLTRANVRASPQRWQALGAALMQGDPLMDDLVTWMHKRGMRKARALFQQALDHGLHTLHQPPAPLRKFFESVESPPQWLDDKLLAQGAAVCHRTGVSGLYALRDAALMGGYQASAINKTLVLTGSLTQGPQRRLAETTQWWIDCTEVGGMGRFGTGYKSTLQVRLIHALIRRRVQAMPEWEVAAWGLPINQTDMAATQLGFSVIFLLGSRTLGVPIARDEGEAVMHLWRWIGWLMGVDECWLPTTETEGRVLLHQILVSQAPPDESSRQLGQALMQEPMGRHYANFSWLRARYERARHLSVARLFLDGQSMRNLGLPAKVLPWYPAITLPLNLARQVSGHVLPGGHARLCQTGREAQLAYLDVLFGAVEQRKPLYQPA